MWLRVGDREGWGRTGEETTIPPSPGSIVWLYNESFLYLLSLAVTHVECKGAIVCWKHPCAGHKVVFLLIECVHSAKICRESNPHVLNSQHTKQVHVMKIMEDRQ